MREFDIVIIGAATAGSFFAKLMAEKGFSTLVIDALPEREIGKRLTVFHVDSVYFDKTGIPRLGEGDPEYITSFEYSMCESAYGHYPKKTLYPFTVFNLERFNHHLHSWSKRFGVQYEFSTEFKEFIFNEDNKICGVKIKNAEGEEEIYCRLVVDCSGIKAPVRCALPDGYGIENTPLSPRDMFYVILRYVKLANPIKDKPNTSTAYPYYKTWIAPSDDPEGAVIGIGANLSYEYAESVYKDFEKTIHLPEIVGEPIIEKGTTPYRHAIYSLVSDGFLCIGDSAAITKPYSGEGVTASWNLCMIAADVVENAMKDGKYPTRDALWPINVKYSRTQGANFAELMATLVGAIDATKDENEYEFKHNIVFDEAVMTQMNYAFANKMTVRQILYLVNEIIDARANGSIRKSTISNIISSLLKASKLKKHYKSFPKKAKKFEKWCTKADELWKEAGCMADIIEKSFKG